MILYFDIQSINIQYNTTIGSVKLVKIKCVENTSNTVHLSHLTKNVAVNFSQKNLKETHLAALSSAIAAVSGVPYSRNRLQALTTRSPASPNLFISLQHSAACSRDLENKTQLRNELCNVEHAVPLT